jgi:hypothetical protein
VTLAHFLRYTRTWTSTVVPETDPTRPRSSHPASTLLSTPALRRSSLPLLLSKLLGLSETEGCAGNPICRPSKSIVRVGAAPLFFALCDPRAFSTVHEDLDVHGRSRERTPLGHESRASARPGGLVLQKNPSRRFILFYRKSHRRSTRIDPTTQTGS